jgi:glucose-1-phosphate thymidylyltransferase|tara:strand:+ start:1050 stop:1910 length:861 start_codon:yes stop_codon:yes gene_type:complete
LIKKGIILAGGTGTRLSPLTKSVNKQLLPLYDKPLIFYPLSILMLAGIKNVLIIVNNGQEKNFFNILGNGKRYGINIKYKVQKKPRGIADAFILGKNFIKKDNVALILGDNFFYGQSLTTKLLKAKSHKSGATVFLKIVRNPESFGVAVIKKLQISKIVEKPKKFISNQAITGLYFFDNKVVQIASKVKPSKRNELEITDVLKSYQSKNNLNYEEIGRGAIWSDAGKIKDLTNLSNFVHSVEKVQNVKIACLDEIALNQKWISREQLKNNITFYGNCDYSDYLKLL